MKNMKKNRIKKKNKICGLIVWAGCFMIAVNMAYGMELGGFGIDIGVGSGNAEDVWSNSEDQTGNNAVMENNTVPGINVVPEVETMPEIEDVPEVEIIPEVEYIPEMESEPKEEYIPEAEYKPEAEYVPKEEYIPEAEYVPKEEYKPEVEYVPKGEYIPKVEDAAEVKDKSEKEHTRKTENINGDTIKTATKESMLEAEQDSGNKLSPTPELTPMVTISVDNISEDISEQLSVLEFYEEEANIQKRKMKCYRYEKFLEMDEMYIFQLPSEDVVHILSFRINGKECEWEIKENMLIGKSGNERMEALVEIMYLCDEEVYIMLTEE